MQGPLLQRHQEIGRVITMVSSNEVEFPEIMSGALSVYLLKDMVKPD